MSFLVRDNRGRSFGCRTEAARCGVPTLSTRTRRYNTVKLMPKAEPLLTAKSPSSGKTHTVAWVNYYRKARIYGTTLGHDMKTGADPDYQRLLAFGLLWACDKLATDGRPMPDMAGPRRPRNETGRVLSWRRPRFFWLRRRCE
jgi:hypothetical protein